MTTHDPAHADPYFPLEIQLSRGARARFGLPPELGSGPRPSPIFPLRLLSLALNGHRSAPPVSAGELGLLATLSAIFRFVVSRHLDSRRFACRGDRLRIAGRSRALGGFLALEQAFVEAFPCRPVLAGEETPKGFLTHGRGSANQRAALVELFLLALQNENPAAAGCLDLFSERELPSPPDYRRLLDDIDRLLREAPADGLLGGSLLGLLRRPLRAAPASLSGQLGYIDREWGELLPPELRRRLLTALDLYEEERRPRAGGPGPPAPPGIGEGAEPEAFSADADWMPNVVLLAKSVHVWLDQLSRRYGREIRRLDQIPSEELETLAARGFTGLWLIGLWERSVASQWIKQRRGNPEAVASAYSLYDYTVAAELGGEQALAELRERCTRRGIRLACDVVPNHTGIYSRWTREHPDWFIQLDHPPYPGYRFGGPELSASDDISLQIDEGYWDHSEAAVVFRHLDRRSGKVRYIYHGNDGTHLPWNDTAQLNFLLPQVREAMIRTIIGVARHFRIIRFDAAMTLARKHFQRLWFPQPGHGGGVPSRGEHGMTREEFDRVFPVEFWREVVDRVAAEAPDTLLLAEAFWLMEGFFVRTLGMHRVYNSAFMNMLKAEENGRYRTVLKETLEFNPEILKRFVNFMSNPDEASAAEQFDTGEKYFAVAVLLATLPGLPMFGHGQVEGLREKYGMEYRRAYWEETVDEGLLRHHEAHIFPLLRRRSLFSGSEEFFLYDFFAGGRVNEDVIAFSNRRGSERALVAVHNRHADTSGWLRTACARRVRPEGGEERLEQQTLGEALGLDGGEGVLYRFREHRSAMEYLRRGRDLCREGLELHLGPFGYAVFLDFREIRDAEGSWGALCDRLGGAPRADLDLELRRLRYAPLGALLAEALAPLESEGLPGKTLPPALHAFYAALEVALQLPGGAELLAGRFREAAAALTRLGALGSRRESEGEALASLAADAAPKGPLFRVALPWLLLRRLGEPGEPGRPVPASEALLGELLLEEALAARWSSTGDLSPEEAGGEALLLRLLVRHQTFWQPGGPAAPLSPLFEDPLVREYLGVNRHKEELYLVKERLESLTAGLSWVAAVAAVIFFGPNRRALLADLAARRKKVRLILAAAGEAGYRLGPWLIAPGEGGRS